MANSTREGRNTVLMTAVARLLEARQGDMVTVEEWLRVARALAGCVGGKTADYLTERDLEQIAKVPRLEWDEATDGPLPLQ